jgi:hypothetical protein
MVRALQGCEVAGGRMLLGTGDPPVAVRRLFRALGIASRQDKGRKCRYVGTWVRRPRQWACGALRGQGNAYILTLRGRFVPQPFHPSRPYWGAWARRSSREELCTAT